MRAFRDQHNLNLIAILPFDEQAIIAEADGLILLETNPGGILVHAIANLIATRERALNGTE